MGTVLDISRETGLSWSLTLSALTHHCFVTGTTGSGKSNTCRYLLEQLHAHGIPFWVLEPAKREYRSLLKHRALRDRVRVYTPGNERVAPLRLNLFQPPAGTLLSEWIGGLKTVISSSFALYGSMPQLLERSLYQAYEEQGWNTARDVVSAKESRAFPTLTSFVATLTTVIDEAGYGRELSADFHGALTTRIRSLTLGSTGAMLNSTVRCDVRELLCYPTIFEFASVTNDQELSLLMGVLLLNLAAVRRSDGSSANLKHLLVLEEAHRLLPALGPLAETSEVAQTRSQAVNLFVNMLAELRASGQGFVLADQSPEKIVSDALKNTGTKIVHRLPDLPDRNAVGNTMALTAIQKTALARLNKGAAVVYTEGPTPAALVHVPLMLTLPPVTDEEIRKSMAPHLLVEQTASAGPALSAKITTPERPEQSETGLFRGVELLRCLLSGKTPDDLQPDQVRQYVADRAAFLRIETGEADRLQHLLLDAADRTLTNDQNRRAWEQFAADMSRLMLAKRHEQTRCADCPSHVCYGAETEGMMASVAWWQALRQSLESGDAAALREFSTAVAHHPDMTMDSSTEPVRSALVRCLGIRVLAEFDFAEPWATFNRLG